MKTRALMLTTCGVCLLGLSALALADDALPPPAVPTVEETAPVPPETGPLLGEAPAPVEDVQVTLERPEMPQPNERTLEKADAEPAFIAYSAAPGGLGNIPEPPTSLVPEASIEAASASLDAAVADQAAATSEMPETLAIPATVEAKVDTSDATPTGAPMIRDGHLITH